MKYIKTARQSGKTIIGVFALAVMMMLSMSGSSSAADEFVRIKIYPENVGVFTSVGDQQFVAFGIAANGSTTNITDRVSWESSDPSIVTIDENGLASLVDAGTRAVINGTKQGYVNISCSYPKASNSLAVVHLLLDPNRGNNQ